MEGRGKLQCDIELPQPRLFYIKLIYNGSDMIKLVLASASVRVIKVTNYCGATMLGAMFKLIFDLPMSVVRCTVICALYEYACTYP